MYYVRTLSLPVLGLLLPRTEVLRSSCSDSPYVKLSHFSLRSMVSLDSLLSELGPLRSEVRGPFRALSDVDAFGFSMTSTLDEFHGLLRCFPLWTRSFYTEVRGPFRSSLRRRRFQAFSNVRASFLGPFLYGTRVLLTEVHGLFGLLLLEV